MEGEKVPDNPFRPFFLRRPIFIHGALFQSHLRVFTFTVVFARKRPRYADGRVTESR